jgi:hypothetical protein
MMSHRVAVLAVAIGASLLVGATPPTSPQSRVPAACSYRPDADRNAGLVAGEPKVGLLYLAARGRFYEYRCADATTSVVYVPTAPTGTRALEAALAGLANPR